jgi:hypothetical protein
MSILVAGGFTGNFDPSLVIRFDLSKPQTYRDGVEGDIYNWSQSVLNGQRQRTPLVGVFSGRGYLYNFGHDGVDWSLYNVSDSHTVNPPYRRLPAGADDRTFIAAVMTPSDRVELKHIFMYGSTEPDQGFGLGLQGSTGVLECHIWGEHPRVDGNALDTSTLYTVGVIYRHDPPVGETRFLFGIKKGADPVSIYKTSAAILGDRAINTGTAYGMQVGMRIAGFEPWNAGGRIYEISGWNRSMSEAELIEEMDAAAMRQAF